MEIADLDLTKLSPMMHQYLEIKRANMDCLVFFRLGDFYELFFDDAIKASKILEIALTGRDCGQKERAPMCGVPHHAVNGYLSKLIASGLKVAICEQTEDANAKKGIVSRQITRIVTPGTVIETENLDSKRNNYLIAIYQLKKYYALAYIDITTYDLFATNIVLGNCQEILMNEIKRLQSSEIVCNSLFFNSSLAAELVKDNILLSELKDKDFKTSKYSDFLGNNYNNNDLWPYAVNGLLSYIEEMQLQLPNNLEPVNLYQHNNFLYLDQNARRNLEITEALHTGSRKGSLLDLLDTTETAMGGRYLRRMVEQPLIDLEQILARLDSVDELKNCFIERMELKKQLQGMTDMERITTKIINNNATPRDLASLKLTLGRLPKFIELGKSLKSPLLVRLINNLDSFNNLYDLLDRALVEQPPVIMKDGGIIKVGYNSECDELREASSSGRNWILDLEKIEKEKSGIRNLKTGYNRIFGYYFEVTNSNKEKIPEHFIRKQTLANAERFITEELKNLEAKVLGSQQKLLELEQALFIELRSRVGEDGSQLLHTARNLAYLDALLSLATVAEKNRYNRPCVDNSTNLTINAGRHPVVEQFLNQGSYVANDSYFDDQQRLILLTGPNMAGKSTYMRQIALIVIMAQIGSFVPADTANIGLTDAVYTRIGASDNLASGQSTFMVEMQEVATILKLATDRSLLILDEVGRGTSTYDGLAIASAVIEAIADPKQTQCRTLFATHYHELISMPEKLPTVSNYQVMVERQGNEIIFLHKIAKGGSDDSYGIEVARLAGVPGKVVRRATNILAMLERNNSDKNRLKLKDDLPINGQLDFYQNAPEHNERQQLIDKLAEIAIETLSPLDAFNMLHNLSNEAKQLQSDTNRKGSHEFNS